MDRNKAHHNIPFFLHTNRKGVVAILGPFKTCCHSTALFISTIGEIVCTSFQDIIKLLKTKDYCHFPVKKCRTFSV